MSARRERAGRSPGGSDHGGRPTTPKIHGYAIQGVIGRGGAAIVYLARERKHGRLVALKVLRPDLSASLHAERFLREIEIVAALSHPNILPLLDSGRTSELLYYVTPYVSGESLRGRLTRERQLSVRDSIAIVREVAEALDYAHRRGVVHRDIKPENILLEDGHAVVADFGIARALSVAGEQHITAQGLVIGTAPYMSPEQASGEGVIDGRSDIYSLGCVLFELLSGATPFTGTTPVHFVAQHLASPVPSLRALRPTITPALEETLSMALAKVPADRYATARQFSEALAEVTTGSHHPVEGARRRPSMPNARRAAAAALALALAGGGVWAASRVVASRGTAGRDSGRLAATSPADAALDTTRFVVLPADPAGGGAAPVDVSERLGNALERWSGLTVVDALQMRDTLLSARRAGRTVGPGDPRAVALALGAGRYVRAQTTGGRGDSLTTVRATLYDTRRNARLSDATARVAVDPARGDSAIADLVSDLLFPDRPPDTAAEPMPGTRSYPARDAYLRAHAAVERWDLASADSLFLAATVHDPHYARAFLWLAQVRSWRREPADPRWRFAAEQAYAERATLAPREALLADALRALANGETVRACALWSRLTTLAPSDYTAWYGLGACRRSDEVVVRDPRSPSGWRFRTSYRQTLAAYRRAFQLFPSLHRSSRGGSFDDVQEILMTSSGANRRGFALTPDTLGFLAYPSWQGDTLAFVPYPESEFASGRAVTHSEAVNAAIRRQRKQFYDIATTWRSAFPQSADALEAVAISLDLLGNDAAMDTLRLARRMAVDEAARLHMATLEALMRVKFAAPADVAGLREAQRLADSVLGAHRPADRAEARQMAALAALLGRANLAASYARLGESQSVPAAIAQTAPALLAFAALGGPADSLAALESSVARVIESGMTGTEQESARAAWLLRAAYLAVPERRFTSIPHDYHGESVRTKLLVAWRNGELPAARATLRDLGARRRSASIRAFDVTPDALYPEAAVLASLGDAHGAIEWLDPTLDSLTLVDPQALADVARAGALVRAMALRAELAERIGDRAAALAWADAAAALWSKPDPFLEPTVRRLRQMGRGR